MSTPRGLDKRQIQELATTRCTSSFYPTFSIRCCIGILDSQQHMEVFVDLEVLKKKISSYRTQKGHLTRVPDELVMEILVSWEEWTGTKTGFYSAIGVNQHKLASILGKAKKLRREGHFPVEEFKEIRVSGQVGSELPPCSGIELVWDAGKLIRFTEVIQLIDFLKKVA